MKQLKKGSLVQWITTGTVNSSIIIYIGIVTEIRGSGYGGSNYLILWLNASNGGSGWYRASNLKVLA